MSRPLQFLIRHVLAGCCLLAVARAAPGMQEVLLKGDPGGRHFDGIGVAVAGGLAGDCPEPLRGRILDLLCKPKFGASLSALVVEDTDVSPWWLLVEARKRNPGLVLDAAVRHGPDAGERCVAWLQNARQAHGLEINSIGCHGSEGDLGFVRQLRGALDAGGFRQVKLHTINHRTRGQFDFIRDLAANEDARGAVDLFSVCGLQPDNPAPMEIQELAARMGKPIWSTGGSSDLKGFDAALGIVECFNKSFIKSGATKLVIGHDGAVIARSPSGGRYEIGAAMWGYAHCGQFTEVGWEYMDGGCGELGCGGSFVSLKGPSGDYSIILETKGATGSQPVAFQISGGLTPMSLCVWRSNANEQFTRLPDITPVDGAFTLRLDPDSIYSLSTTTGQQKGTFADVPAEAPYSPARPAASGATPIH